MSVCWGARVPAIEADTGVGDESGLAGAGQVEVVFVEVHRIAEDRTRALRHGGDLAVGQGAGVVDGAGGVVEGPSL